MDYNIKICSSSNLDNLIRQINAFYFSTNCIVKEDMSVYNTKLNKQVGKVISKKGRFSYYSL